MENTNSVCFIGRIETIAPIEGADKIVKATVSGWNTIIQKDSHNIGDLVLCMTTDAVIPDELAEKWDVKTYLRKGNRVRTVKLKGTYSECLIVGCHIEPNLTAPGIGIIYKEGDDCQEDFKIFKYEPPVREERLPGGKKIRYSENPNFHIYYKFPNQKNVPNMFESSDIIVITRKLHGTSSRYGIVKKSHITLWDWIKKNIFKNKWAYHEFIIGSHRVIKDIQNF